MVFKDIHPQAPQHILAIPKKHIVQLMDLKKEDMPLIVDIHQAIQVVAKQLGVQEKGFRIVVNNGPNAGQNLASGLFC